MPRLLRFEAYAELSRRAEFDLVGRVQRAERINRIAILSTLGAFLAIAAGLILWLFTSVL